MNKKEELITIIVPLYNCEKYVNRLISSVLNQTYKNFELILLNDGSKDGTLNEMKKFTDKRIIVIDKENTGVSDTRNKGLKLAKGELICFLDSDDYLEVNYLQEIINIRKELGNIDLINFGFYSDVENTKLDIISSDIIQYSTKLYKSKNDIKEDFINLWDNTMLYNIWNKVYKKSIIEEKNILFPEYNWGEDVEFNRLYLNEVTNLYNSNKAFYHYIREREGAETKKYKSNLFDIRKKEFYEFNEYFDSWGIDKESYYEFSCRRFIERILGCIENTYCSDMKYKSKYKEIKLFINDKTTRETLKYAKPKSKKVKIMLIPIKLRLTLIVMLMGYIFHSVKVNHPEVFNKMKNRR